MSLALSLALSSALTSGSASANPTQTLTQPLIHPLTRASWMTASSPANFDFPVFGLRADLNWEVQPQVRQDCVFTFSLMQASTGSPIDLAQEKMRLEIVLWMPSMGHGSAPVVIEPLLDGQGQSVPGAFRVRNVQFIMPGDWEVRVTLRHEDGRFETFALALTLPRSPSHGGGHHHH
jgi:hypothetical protein